MQNKTVYLKDYLPPVFEVLSVALHFELYEDHALVTSDMELHRSLPGPWVFYGDNDLELVKITRDNQLLSKDAYRFEDSHLVLDDCADKCHIQIVTRIFPQKNTELSGLYCSKGIFCTQCEAEGFRWITYFPDRPDVLTKYTTRITADKVHYPILLSNGNLIAQGDCDPQQEGRHWAVWEDPFKKPSYLFALVAGKLACVRDTFITQSQRTIDLRIYVEPGQEDKCGHAMASLKKAMRWDEKEYGREYDLDIFMIVAVSDFNMGAMENKGLNIFNAKYILAQPETATDQDFADIEGVVAHEYFHNWTGNRVTCRDWFQLSLKEGLTVFRDQEFSADMNSRDLFRIGDVRSLLVSQFPEDAGSMAHPVRPDSYQQIDNFYTATVYNKGAEVIRMQHTLLGKAGFRRGMDLYFSRHDGKAVTIDDFVAAMEDANQRDLTQFKRWYCQAGTPVVKVNIAFRAQTVTLTLQQACPPTPECHDKLPFHIPIRLAFFSQAGQLLTGYPELIELKEQQQTFTFEGFSEQPIVSLLRDFSAPVILEQAKDDATQMALLRYETNGYAKWNAACGLVTQALHKLVNQNRSSWAIPENLLAALQHIILDTQLDAGLRGELLIPPSFEETIIDLQQVNVEHIENIRDFYKQKLGNYLLETIIPLYDSLWQQEDHALDGPAFARRRLRNVCLGLMMHGDENAALLRCQQQFTQAQTMTDQITAYQLAGQAQSVDLFEKLTQLFYQQWQEDDLVLDKWFAVQATRPHPDVLSRVKLLLTHPAFSLKNPNKIRAVVGAFVMSNPRYFHAADGSGYAFLTEQLQTIDGVNSAIAARLAMPFTRWQRYDVSRQKCIQDGLALLHAQSLSADLREVVEKSMRKIA